MTKRKNVHLLAISGILCLSNILTAVMVVDFTLGLRNFPSNEGSALTVAAIVVVCAIGCLFVVVDRLCAPDTKTFWPAANGTPIHRGLPMSAELPDNAGISQIVN